MPTLKKHLKQKFMEDKIDYKTPKIEINEFSIIDIIHASTPVPCPAGDTCSEENGSMSLDDQILNGQFK